MRYLIQAACVVAIALGGGLFAFGSYLEPRLDPTNPMEAVHSLSQDRDTHFEASLACGFGVGFMTLGGLGLIVPWINILVFRQDERYDSPPPA